MDNIEQRDGRGMIHRPQEFRSTITTLTSDFGVGLGGIEPPTSACKCSQFAERRPSHTPPELDFCGLDGIEPPSLALSVWGQRAGQATGIPYGLPFCATMSHRKTGRATSFGHALGTARS